MLAVHLECGQVTALILQSYAMRSCAIATGASHVFEMPAVIFGICL